MSLTSDDAVELQKSKPIHGCLSPSTLRRRLLAEGTSYKALLDQRRAVLAKGYVTQSGRPLLDIAFQLGFSDPSNFFRSFKRWYGVSPGRYRKQAESLSETSLGMS